MPASGLPQATTYPVFCWNPNHNDTLLTRVKLAAPELLELNRPGFLPGSISFVSERHEMVVL